MPGSLITTILTNLATTLDSVTGVQRVYTYEPVAITPGQIPTVMGSNQAIDFWTVRVAGSRPIRLVGYQMEWDHVVRFLHYYTVGDASVTAPLLDTIILAVLNAFSTVFSITPQAETTGPLEVPEEEWARYFMLADTFLVYRTMYRLPVKELFIAQ